MPLAFLVVLAAIAAINAFAVVAGMTIVAVAVSLPSTEYGFTAAAIVAIAAWAIAPALIGLLAVQHRDVV